MHARTGKFHFFAITAITKTINAWTAASCSQKYSDSTGDGSDSKTLSAKLLDSPFNGCTVNNLHADTGTTPRQETA